LEYEVVVAKKKTRKSDSKIKANSSASIVKNIGVFALCFIALFTLGLAASAAFAVYALGIVLTKALMVLLGLMTAGIVLLIAGIGFSVRAYLDYQAKSQLPAYFKITNRFLAVLAKEPLDSEKRKVLTRQAAVAMITQWNENPSLFANNFKILESAMPSGNYPGSREPYYTKRNAPYNALSNVLHQFQLEDGRQLRALIVQSKDTRAISYIKRLVEIDFQCSGYEKTFTAQLYLIVPYVIDALEANNSTVLKNLILMLVKDSEEENTDLKRALLSWTNTKMDKAQIYQAKIQTLHKALDVAIQSIVLEKNTTATLEETELRNDTSMLSPPSTVDPTVSLSLENNKQSLANTELDSKLACSSDATNSANATVR